MIAAEAEGLANTPDTPQARFALEDEQVLFAEQLRLALAKAGGVDETLRVLNAAEDISAAQWREVVAAGVTAATLPEVHGGLGLSCLFLCVAAQEIGRVCGSLPSISSLYGAADAIGRHGNPSQQRCFLPGLASGELVAAWQPQDPSIMPALRYEGGVISGETPPILDGLRADIAILPARSEAGLVLVLADLAQNGVERSRQHSLDTSRPLATLRFDQISCDAFADVTTASGVLTNMMDRSAVFTAYEQIGGAEAALDMACEYARTRQTFGQTIASYQGISHKLADGYAKIAVARANALYAAKAMEAEDPEAREAAAVARISALDAANYMASENIQTHGAIGTTWEATPHVFYRRAKVQELVLGETYYVDAIVDALNTRNRNGDQDGF